MEKKVAFEDLPVSVTFTEREWKMINECLKIAFDSGQLCEDCLEDLCSIGMRLCDQILDHLENYDYEVN